MAIPYPGIRSVFALLPACVPRYALVIDGSTKGTDWQLLPRGFSPRRAVGDSSETCADTDFFFRKHRSNEFVIQHCSKNPRLVRSQGRWGKRLVRLKVPGRSFPAFAGTNEPKSHSIILHATGRFQPSIEQREIILRAHFCQELFSGTQGFSGFCARNFCDSGIALQATGLASILGISSAARFSATPSAQFPKLCEHGQHVLGAMLGFCEQQTRHGACGEQISP